MKPETKGKIAAVSLATAILAGGLLIQLIIRVRERGFSKSRIAAAISGVPYLPEGKPSVILDGKEYYQK